MSHFGTPAIIWPYDLSVYYCDQHDRFTTISVYSATAHFLTPTAQNLFTSHQKVSAGQNHPILSFSRFNSSLLGWWNTPDLNRSSWPQTRRASITPGAPCCPAAPTNTPRWNARLRRRRDAWLYCATSFFAPPVCRACPLRLSHAFQLRHRAL